jgi:hypothetical protein
MPNTIFSQNTPAGTDNRSEGDDRIREAKTALRSILDTGKVFPADLVVKTNATTPASKVDVTASGLLVSDGSAASYALDAVNVTADITASGANGLDTGAEAANTWYFIWVIYNSSTNTIASLLSTSASAPTMPSGYGYKARVGAVRNDASSNFLPFWKTKNWTYFRDNQVAVNNVDLGTTYSAASLSTAVPTTAIAATLRVQRSSGGGSGHIVYVAWDQSAGTYQAVWAAGAQGAGYLFAYTVPLVTSQTTYWKEDTATADTFRIEVIGYEEPY